MKYFLATAGEKNSEDCIFTIHMFPQNYVQNVNKNDLKRARRVPQGSLMNQKVFYRFFYCLNIVCISFEKYIMSDYLLKIINFNLKCILIRKRIKLKYNSSKN